MGELQEEVVGTVFAPRKGEEGEHQEGRGNLGERIMAMVSGGGDTSSGKVDGSCDGNNERRDCSQ